MRERLFNWGNNTIQENWIHVTASLGATCVILAKFLCLGVL